MSRPREHTERLVDLHTPLPESLHARLRDAAYRRGFTVRKFTELAVTDFLERLVPADEWLFGSKEGGGE